MFPSDSLKNLVFDMELNENIFISYELNFYDQMWLSVATVCISSQYVSFENIFSILITYISNIFSENLLQDFSINNSVQPIPFYNFPDLIPQKLHCVFYTLRKLIFKVFKIWICKFSQSFYSSILNGKASKFKSFLYL